MQREATATSSSHPHADDDLGIVANYDLVTRPKSMVALTSHWYGILKSGSAVRRVAVPLRNVRDTHTVHAMRFNAATQ